MVKKKIVTIITGKKNIKIVNKKLFKYKNLFNLKIVDNIKKITKGHILISFVSGKILNFKTYNRFKYAINFHPAPPSLPGRDPHHWAIYLNKKYFGITIHKLNRKVDTGKIILSKTFLIKKTDTPQALRNKSLHMSLKILEKHFLDFVDGKIYEKKIKWAKIAKRRRDVFYIIDNLKTFDKRKQKIIKKSFGDFLITKKIN